jgi:hypothetical protein
MWIGLPSLRAWAAFFRALCTSRQIVPLDMFIFCPACSCDSPSMSTRRNASSSAASNVIGVWFLGGVGLKMVLGGVLVRVTGLGYRPLFPHRCLPRHILFSLLF